MRLRHGIGSFALSIAAMIGIAGCFSHSRKPVEVPVFYMGTRGYFDYFHRGNDPASKENFRTGRGELEIGEPFRFTHDSKQWRRIQMPKEPLPTQPTTRAAQPNPPPTTIPASQPTPASKPAEPINPPSAPKRAAPRTPQFDPMGPAERQ